MTYHKDIQYGRTPRGSLISKTNDRVHLEITNPEDMAIIAQHLQALTMAGVSYEQERKEVYSPRDKGYVYALVIEYDDKLGLPPLGLSSADEAEEPNITPTPAGTCYQDAWHFLAKQGEGFLVHGSVQLSAEGSRINHAWVELTTGWIWEPQTGQYFLVEDFRIMSPTEEHRYTSEQAAIMIARTGNMGPCTRKPSPCLARKCQAS